MSRERITVRTGKNKKDEIIITLKRDRRINKRHIFITTPNEMKWSEIWKILKNLPKHRDNERKQIKKVKSTKGKQTR